jgi:hypothetical protein
MTGSAYMMSADNDLTAPVLAIKNLFPDKRVIIAFPPQRHSARLDRRAENPSAPGLGNWRLRQKAESIMLLIF